MDHRGVRYPLGPYPEIQEFRAMLRQLKARATLARPHFHATADTGRLERANRFQFWRTADRITLSFGKDEWDCLREVFAIALKDPGLQQVLSALTIEYGDLWATSLRFGRYLPAR